MRPASCVLGGSNFYNREEAKSAKKCGVATDMNQMNADELVLLYRRASDFCRWRSCIFRAGDF